MEDILNLLPQILRQTGYDETVCEHVVFAVWNRTVGEAVSANCVPFRLHAKRLVVLTSDATWKRQLEKISGEIIFKINRVLTTELVTHIEYRVDPRQVKALHREPPEIQFRNQSAIVSELAPIAEKIAQPEMRDAFLRAAGKCLERREREP